MKDVGVKYSRFLARILISYPKALEIKIELSKTCVEYITLFKNIFYIKLSKYCSSILFYAVFFIFKSIFLFSKYVPVYLLATY